MAISAAMQTALETGGYVVEYYAETFNRQGAKTATLDIIDGHIDSSWMDAIRRTTEFVVPLDGWSESGEAFGGLIPESGFALTKRTFGEGEYGSGLYGYNLEVRQVVMSLIKPFQTRLKVWARFTHGSTTETTLLGTFTVSGVTFTDDEDGFVARVAGWDTAGDIMNRKFTSPCVIGATTNITPALEFILDDYIPAGVTMTLPTITDSTTPALSYLPGDGASPWEAAREVAMTAQTLLCVNRDGNIVTETIPLDSTEYPQPVWTVSDVQTISRQEAAPDYSTVVNQVIVVGESASNDEPVVGVAEDLFGPFGINVTGVTISREEVSDKCSTTSQAYNLANALLRKWGALADTYSADTALNPELEPGQVITVSSIGVGLNSVSMVVDSLRYPLSADAFMTVTCTRTV